MELEKAIAAWEVHSKRREQCLHYAGAFIAVGAQVTVGTGIAWLLGADITVGAVALIAGAQMAYWNVVGIIASYRRAMAVKDIGAVVFDGADCDCANCRRERQQQSTQLTPVPASNAREWL